MKILLVDDDAFLRDMYATKFKEKGHEIGVAETGEAGLKEMKENTYDAVLLDMVMPGISGIDFIKSATTDKPANTRLIVLSNQSEESDKSAAKEAGASGYIVKAETVPSDVVGEVEKICHAKDK